jgi:hypothetical protein
MSAWVHGRRTLGTACFEGLSLAAVNVAVFLSLMSLRDVMVVGADEAARADNEDEDDEVEADQDGAPPRQNAVQVVPPALPPHQPVVEDHEADEDGLPPFEPPLDAGPAVGGGYALRPRGPAGGRVAAVAAVDPAPGPVRRRRVGPPPPAVAPPPEDVPAPEPAPAAPAPAPVQPAADDADPLGDAGGNEDMSLEELLGLRGPLIQLAENVTWFVLFNGLVLVAAAFAPYMLGRAVVLGGTRAAQLLAQAVDAAPGSVLAAGNLSAAAALGASWAAGLAQRMPAAAMLSSAPLPRLVAAIEQGATTALADRLAFMAVGYVTAMTIVGLVLVRWPVGGWRVQRHGGPTTDAGSPPCGVGAARRRGGIVCVGRGRPCRAPSAPSAARPRLSLCPSRYDDDDDDALSPCPRPRP